MNSWSHLNIIREFSNEPRSSFISNWGAKLLGANLEWESSIFGIPSDPLPFSLHWHCLWQALPAARFHRGSPIWARYNGIVSILACDIVARLAVDFPNEIWLVSCDGLASFKWTMKMVEAYLPSIMTYIVQVITARVGFCEGADNTFSIALDRVSGDVLEKLDKYLYFFFGPKNTCRFYNEWNLNSFPIWMLSCWSIKLKAVSKTLLDPQYWQLISFSCIAYLL